MEEPLDEDEKRIRRAPGLDEDLEDRFYKNGVKPEWLVVHRVINHRTMKDGRTIYLVKWRELPYDQATWEEDSDEIPGLRPAIEYYLVSGTSLTRDHLQLSLIKN